MSNRIRDVKLVQKRLSTAEAEVWVVVEPERRAAATEVRGRVVGPRCPGVETIEVAYPLRPLASGGDALTLRLVVPEPNLWTAERPYVYEGAVELWQAGERCDLRTISMGFRVPGA
jgi:beta-galactosidase/beta-glucuronidase